MKVYSQERRNMVDQNKQNEKYKRIKYWIYTK